MLRAFHVDEIDDDDAAEVAQPDLPHGLGRGLEIDLEHRLLEVPLADVLACIDVDGDQGFRMVDHDVTAGLEPHAPPQRLVDLLLDPCRLEDGRGLLPELDAGGQLRHERLGKAQTLLIGGERVDEELVHIGREEVAHHAESQVHLLVEKGGRAGGLEAALHLAPQPGEKLNVRFKLGGVLALGDRPHDEAARRRRQSLDDAAEPLSLAVVVYAPGHPDVPRLGHVDDVAPRDRHE